MSSRLAARFLRASTLVDRAYRRFDQARSLLVTGFASDSVLDDYNDLTYDATSVYDANSSNFRGKLFGWESRMVDQVFPPPPCRVLIGGAGGGREAFQLAARGYEVTAFEPARQLARSMADRARHTGATVQALCGRYEEMPVVRATDSLASVNLALLPRFDAAMLGWTSFSHLRSSRARIAALRAFGDVTDGPVVASFYNRPPVRHAHSRLRRRLERLGRRVEGDAFTTHIGYYHFSSQAELTEEIQAAGMVLLDASFDESDGHWPWVAVARPEIGARLRGNPESSVSATPVQSSP